MKKPIHILSFIAILACSILGASESRASNYYFSTATGDDARSAEEAKNPDTPWKTIQKLNSSMELIGPGDSVLFMRGDIFQGGIILSRSGSADQKIVFSAYGSGRAPIIMGDAFIDSWNQHEGNIWVATPPEGISTVTNFLIDGHSQQMGRYPNTDAGNSGYLTIDSHVGHTSLTCSSLTASPDWVGAEAVVRTDRWILDPLTVQSHEGATVVFASSSGNEIRDNYGFFFQKHLQTLDQQGEWYYDLEQNRIYLYTLADPNELSTSISAYSSSFSSSNRSHFALENLEFRGSYETNVRIYGASDALIRNNLICESGMVGVLLLGCNQVVFSGNKIERANDVALVINACNDVDVQDNDILNIGLRAGMGNTYSGVTISRSVDNLQFGNNRIDSIGYTAVSYRGDFIRIWNNYITHFCMTIDDGAGLYTDGDGLTVEKERYLENNIVMFAVGAGDGTDAPDYIAVEGIYTDDRTNNVNILNNTVAYCKNGIFVHNADHITIIGNTLFDNTTQIYFGHDHLYPQFPITDCVVKDNIFFSKLGTQSVAEFVTLDEGITLMGLFDNNYYCRPLSEDGAIYASQVGDNGRASEFLTLEMWQSTFKHDLNSQKSPFPIAGYEVVEYLGDDLVENGTLDSDKQGWSQWSTHNNGYAVWDDKEEMDGGSLKIGFDGLSGEPDSKMQCQVRFNGPEKDQAYLMTFSSLATDPGNLLRVSMLEDNAPYDFITEHQYVSTEGERGEHELLFIPGSTKPRTRIAFDLAEGPGSLWLDNVTLRHVDAEITDMNDHVRLLYNPGNEPLSVEVPDNSYDVDGNLLESSLIIQPFSAVVLMNGDKVYTSLRESREKELFIYPNPAYDILHFRSADMRSKQITIIDLSGRIVISEYSGSEVDNLDISALQQGLYFLQIYDGAERVTARFIKN